MNNFHKLKAILEDGDWSSCHGCHAIRNAYKNWCRQNSEYAFYDTAQLQLLSILSSTNWDRCTEANVVKQQIDIWYTGHEEINEVVSEEGAVSEVNIQDLTSEEEELLGWAEDEADDNFDGDCDGCGGGEEE